MLLAVSVTTALAENPVRLKSAGLYGGILMPQKNWDNGFAVAVQTDFGEIMKYVFLQPYAGYWRAKTSVNESELSFSDIHFGTKFVGFINSKPRGVYAGLGLQFHIIGQEEYSKAFETAEPEINKQHMTRVGYSIVTGYLLVMKRVSLAVEPAYTVLPGLENMITINIGISYLLP